MLSDQTPVPKAPRLSKAEESSHVFRVDTVHGGTVVEQIEKPQPMNDPDCVHEWEIDPTETDFLAYMCIKNECGIVVLYDK